MNDIAVPALPAVIARDHAHADRQQVWFVGDRFIQGGDLNDAQIIARRRHDQLGRLIAKDGDRREGCEAMIDREEETITLAAGRLYVAGDVLPVASRVIANVPLTGRATIGVRLVRSYIDHEQDPALRGQIPGTEAQGEKGNYRELATISWALESENLPGEFVPVYTLLEGTIIDQAPPPALSGIMQQIAGYDMDANGHYIVDGCEVSCIGKSVDEWVFSLAPGTANVQGYKRIRETSLRFTVVEDADLEDVVAEVHNYSAAGGAAVTVQVNRAPIHSLTSVVIVKRVVENVTRGAVPGTADNLNFNSVYEVESVVQGATTYVAGSDYQVVGGQIDWSPGGAEPSGSSTYTVTYLYSEAVSPTAQTETSITVSGGAQNKPITLRYMSKIPRIDLICLDITGAPRYVKGIAARSGGLAPLPPTSLLKLAEVENNWLTLPRIVNNGVRNYTYEQMRRLFGRLIDVLDQFGRQTALNSITASTPVAKKGIFTDNFVDDFFRDQGEAQTAACNQGVLQLAIDPVMLQLVGGEAVTKPYTEMVVAAQTLRTASMKINPYANFNRMPAGMRLAPAVDFWTETATQWLSDVTREFTAAPDQPPGQTVINEVTQVRRETSRFLRQIEVSAVLEGFGVGENLEKLTFDGIDITPAGPLAGDANGEIALSFNIPPNVPTGTKRVRAEGASGSFAEARFVGEGTIDVNVMRRVTLVARAAPPPVINNITNITNVTNTTINQITQQVVTPPVSDIRIEPGLPMMSDRNDESGGIDPLAQSFSVPAPYMLTGVNFWFTAIGDRAHGVRVQLATMANGYPTAEVLAEAFVSMATVEAGDKIEVRFDLPVYCVPWREYCFVILTDDPEHSVAISRLGDVIVETQERVGAQPYTVGVMFSSANRLTWTPHQDADIAFELVAAVFDDDDLTVTIWQGELDQISDLLVRGAVEVPSDEGAFRYELVRNNGQVLKFAPGQAMEFSEYVDEEVTLRAVLSGNERISPILYPGTMIAGGRLRSTGTYVTRAFAFGAAVEASALVAAKLPAGASASFDARIGTGAWQTMSLDSTGTLGDGWVEPKHKRAGMTGALGQVRITLNGTPSARPSLAMMRAYTI